jgi:hypothetical protein
MNDLFWSFLRGHRFEAIVLLVVVVCFVAGSASALAYVVNSLFEPINRVLGQALGG